jgi:hypothetical protein
MLRLIYIGILIGQEGRQLYHRTHRFNIGRRHQSRRAIILLRAGLNLDFPPAEETFSVQCDKLSTSEPSLVIGLLKEEQQLVFLDGYFIFGLGLVVVLGFED